MDSFRSLCEPRDMALTFLLLYATALYRVISEMQSLPGFRFTPNNDDIIDYVKRKRLDPDFSFHRIKEIDIYSFEPWDLLGKELVLYIFSEPNYKYKKSKRQHRRTSEGYWKVTSQDSEINAIGSKRTLTFYHWGSKTDWSMYEFYVEDDPLYKKDFVLCRIERKRQKTKHGIPTNDEDQSNQQLVCYSSKPVTENTILNAVQQPSKNLDSNRSFVTQNTFSKTQLLPGDPVNSYSRNQGEENTFLDSQQLCSDHLISSFRNHVTENGFPESQLPPNNNMISCSGNHFAENVSAESQLPPNYNMISNSQLSPNLNMISYSGNHVEENGSSELQQQPNHNMIPCNGNHVAGNGSPESQQLPIHNTISCFQLQPNYNMTSYFGSHVAQKASAESQLPPNYNVISCSQVPPNHDMISHSGNHVAEPNRSMISNYGNHVAGNGSLESQLLPNQDTFSHYGNRVAKNGSPQPLLNQEMVSHYGNHVEVIACKEWQQLLLHKLISDRNHFTQIASPLAQAIANHNMISCSGSHIAENTSFELQQLLPDHNLISYPGNQMAKNMFEDSQILPNQRLDFYSMNNVTESISDAKPLPLAESNAASGYSGVNNASISALQSPIYSEQGSSYANCVNNGGDGLTSQFGNEGVNFLINSESTFQNESSSDQTGQTPIPHFNSSEPDAGVEDSRDMDDAWVKELEFLLD